MGAYGDQGLDTIEAQEGHDWTDGESGEMWNVGPGTDELACDRIEKEVGGHLSHHPLRGDPDSVSASCSGYVNIALKVWWAGCEDNAQA